MEQTKELILSWWWNLGIVGAGFIVGVFVDVVIFRQLKRLAVKTEWPGDELIWSALAKKMPFWGLLVGFAISIPFMPISPKLAVGISRATYVVLILSVTWVLAKLAADLIELSSQSGSGTVSTTIFKVLAKIGVWGIGIAVLLHHLGVSIAPVLTAFGVGGLAVALALQDTLSNLFAGIQIILAKQVKVGDYIKIDELNEGFVTDINWRNTTIRALSNNQIVIPNSKLASTIAVNYNMPEKVLSVIVQVGVAYDSDLEKVERAAIETAADVMQNVPGGVAEHQPFIRYHTLADSSINFSVILRAKEFTDQYLIRHEFIKRLIKRFNEENIQIPFPQRVVHYAETNTVFNTEIDTKKSKNYSSNNFSR